MKKTTKILSLAIALLTVAVVISSCAMNVLLGTYTNDAGGTLAGYKVSYTFKVGNKVVVTSTSTLLGSSKTVEYEGTYKILKATDGTKQIVLTFESEDASSYSGTYSFSEGTAEDGKTPTITIGMSTYTKV